MVLHANRNGKVCYLHCHASCWPSLVEVRASTRKGRAVAPRQGNTMTTVPPVRATVELKAYSREAYTSGKTEPATLRPQRPDRAR